jgi:hypothetical protein
MLYSSKQKLVAVQLQNLLCLIWWRLPNGGCDVAFGRINSELLAVLARDAWHSLGGMSRGAAMKQYASKVEDFASGTGSGNNESTLDQGFSLANSVSTMKFQDG